MGARLLNGRDDEKAFFIDSLYPFYSKLTSGERACLVEDHSVDFAYGIEIVASLEKNAFARGGSYAREIAQRDADDQGTRTAYDEEYQRTAEPLGEGVVEVGRHQTVTPWQDDGKQRQQHDDRRVDVGKAVNHCLSGSLARGRLFHHI